MGSSNIFQIKSQSAWISCRKQQTVSQLLQASYSEGTCLLKNLAYSLLSALKMCYLECSLEMIEHALPGVTGAVLGGCVELGCDSACWLPPGAANVISKSGSWIQAVQISRDKHKQRRWEILRKGYSKGLWVAQGRHSCTLPFSGGWHLGTVLGKRPGYSQFLACTTLLWISAEFAPRLYQQGSRDCPYMRSIWHCCQSQNSYKPFRNLAHGLRAESLHWDLYASLKTFRGLSVTMFLCNNYSILTGV